MRKERRERKERERIEREKRERKRERKEREKIEREEEREERERKKRSCICSVSFAQGMTFCLTLEGCAMNHQCAMLTASILHKFDEWVVSHTNTPPVEDDNLLLPW